MNECGTCTMCCKLFSIPALKKPTNVWCQHCEKNKGCGIYDSRPEMCQEFECFWLQAKHHGVEVSDNLRPDKCKVVIAATTNPHIMSVHCDPGFPQAWRNPKVMALLNRLLEQGMQLAVTTGTSKITQLASDGRGGIVTRERVMSEPDEQGMRWTADEDK